LAFRARWPWGRSRRERLAVVLTTQGGVIEVVEHMVAVLRHEKRILERRGA
jgi:hypothetical protein